MVNIKTKVRKKNWWYQILIPNPDREYMGHWHTLPEDVYDHKRYPKCKICGEKYVPIEGMKECFKCNFTR